MSSISATAPSRSPAFSFSKKTSIVSTAPMGGVYRRAPPTTLEPSCRDASPLAAVRPAHPQRASRPPPADRRRAGRPCRAGPIRHPRRGRDAVRGAVDDAAKPRVRDRFRASTTGRCARTGRPRNGGSTWPSSGTGSSSPPRRSPPKASRSTTWSTPARGSPGGSSGRGSARRCGARSWRSRSTTSVRRSPNPRRSSTTPRRTRSRRAWATSRTGSAGSHRRACRGRPRSTA